MNQPYPVMKWKEIRLSILHLCYPHICAGCGQDLPDEDAELCLRCLHSLPETCFEQHPGNPVEKLFRGRLPLVAATAQFYFTKESLMQQLLHLLKYKGQKDLGLYLGRLMGRQLLQAARIIPDALVPLPLFPQRERKRGYNQATILCQGMAEVMHLPVLDKVITRPEHTDTQTKKGRVDRWKNMEGKFAIVNRDAIRGKHLLLVDDVITTGATLEACGHELLQQENTRLSVASLCIATH